MKIKLTRDEARCVQHNMFPYLLRLTDVMVINSGHDQNKNLDDRIIRCITRNIKIKFDKKLNGFSNKFSIELPDHECIVLYKLLLAMPVKDDEIWMQKVRNDVLSMLFQYLNEPQHHWDKTQLGSSRPGHQAP